MAYSTTGRQLLRRLKDCPGDHAFNNMNDKNQLVFLQSRIADQLSDDLFVVGLFGLDGDMEKCLRKLERQLEEREGMCGPRLLTLQG